MKKYEYYTNVIKDANGKTQEWKTTWRNYLDQLKNKDMNIPPEASKETKYNMALVALLRYRIMQWTMLEAELEARIDTIKLKNINTELLEKAEEEDRRRKKTRHKHKEPIKIKEEKVETKLTKVVEVEFEG